MCSRSCSSWKTCIPKIRIPPRWYMHSCNDWTMLIHIPKNGKNTCRLWTGSRDNTKTRPATALLLYTRALAYFERAKLTGEDGKLLHPDFNKKAVELGEKSLANIPVPKWNRRHSRSLAQLNRFIWMSRFPTTCFPGIPAGCDFPIKA